MRKAFVGVVFGLAALLLAGPARAQTLTGTGSTFIASLMGKWSKEYAKAKGVTVKYEASNSAVGTSRLLAKTVDFGCTDVPLPTKELDKAKKDGNEIVHVPLALGAVVPAYNLPGVDKQLRFTGPILADIYLGKITKWNDRVLSAVNPGVKLPDRSIVVVHRSDTSGTTLLWADYLAKVSKEAKDKLGVKGLIKWPVGIGAKGNLAVATEVAKTPGAIGYMELIYALAKKVPYGQVMNQSGQFISANRATVAASVAGIKTFPADLRFRLTDSPAKSAYPICGMSYALVYAKHPKEKAKALSDFLTWVTHDGQRYCDDLRYVPLPAPLVAQVEARLRLISVGS